MQQQPITISIPTLSKNIIDEAEMAMKSVILELDGRESELAQTFENLARRPLINTTHLTYLYLKHQVGGSSSALLTPIIDAGNAFHTREGKLEWRERHKDTLSVKRAHVASLFSDYPKEKLEQMLRVLNTYYRRETTRGMTKISLVSLVSQRETKPELEIISNLLMRMLGCLNRSARPPSPVAGLAMIEASVSMKNREKACLLYERVANFRRSSTAASIRCSQMVAELEAKRPAQLTRRLTM